LEDPEVDAGFENKEFIEIYSFDKITILVILKLFNCNFTVDEML